MKNSNSQDDYLFIEILCLNTAWNDDFYIMLLFQLFFAVYQLWSLRFIFAICYIAELCLKFNLLKFTMVHQVSNDLQYSWGLTLNKICKSW